MTGPLHFNVPLRERLRILGLLAFLAFGVAALWTVMESLRNAIPFGGFLQANDFIN
jgi:uncharacterized membrane protein